METRRRESAGRGRGERVRRRCVVLTDSNGRGVTSDTIMSHVRGEAKEWEVQVERVYTLEEARDRVRRGDIRVEGARVVVDCVTNDVRGTRRRGQAEPREVAERLREAIREMGRAERIVVCEVKPMQQIDVVPFNARIHALIGSTEGVEGSSTQIRPEYLLGDGYHIAPRCVSVLDRQYACAMVGRAVPCPYFSSAIYNRMMAEWAEREWPPLGGRQANGGQGGQGWRAPSRPYGGKW